MPLTAGIVGLPNVGKSTLFNAITNQRTLVANYPFATIEPNIGVVNVVDERLDILKNIYNILKVIPTTFIFTDIAGLVKGSSQGEGLGNKFLNHIKEVDAICEVVRCFRDDSITHVENDINSIRDINIIKEELINSDLDIINNRIEKINKKAITTKDKDLLNELNLIERLMDVLKKGIPLRKLTYNKEELNIIKRFNLLTIKPVIYIANITEEDINKRNKDVELLKDYLKEDNAQVIEMCIKLESEISELNENDKELFLNELKLNSSSLDNLVKTTYSLLNLGTFFTYNKEQVEAWTFKKGISAKECAGLIHNDFENNFIKAEVINYDELIQYGDHKEAKRNGKVRIEGKDYIVKDGDICFFKI